MTDGHRFRYRSWLLALVCSFPMAASAGEEQPAEPLVEEAKACIDCHGTPYVLGILKTAHAKASDPKTPAAQEACQSCHGPSDVHMKFPMQVANVHFGKESASKPAVQNKLCLDCHDEDGGREAWGASAHGYEDIVCSTCHSAHDPDKIVPEEATVSSGCTDSCHEDLMGHKSVSDFSHALGQDLEGQGELTCAGCHNPHGPLSSERCIDCHAQTPEVLAKESAKAKRYHKVAAERGTECIRCHKGIAHPISKLALEASEQEMRRLVPE